MKLSVSVVTMHNIFWRFFMSRKGGVEGGGWVHPKSANSKVVSELGCRKALVGTG